LSRLRELAVMGNSGDLIQLEDSSYISLRPRNKGTVPDIESKVEYIDGSNVHHKYTITTAAGGMTFTIPSAPADGQLPQIDVDMVLDVVLKYRVYDESIVWTIANGLYGDPDHSPSSPDSPLKTILNGGIIIRFGQGSADTGEGETIVKVRPGIS
jgi:hypothetical protein